MRADLDTLLTAIYVLLDDFLPDRAGPGRPPRITDAELITVAIAQAFLGIPNDRQFLGLAAWRLGHLFPYLPGQPGYNKRLRALALQIVRSINYLAFVSPSIFDDLRLLDSTPVPCGASRETVRRSEFGTAAYGHCASHGRWFWGFRLYLLCASDGTPIAFELAPANAPERVVAKEMLESVSLVGHTVIADKGFSGREFEGFMADRGATFLRPDRKDERPRFGSLGSVRQRIESVFWTWKGQLGLERHGARTMPGLFARIGIRLLALSPGYGTTGRSTTRDATSPPTPTELGIRHIGGSNHGHEFVTHEEDARNRQLRGAFVTGRAHFVEGHAPLLEPRPSRPRPHPAGVVAETAASLCPARLPRARMI